MSTILQSEMAIFFSSFAWKEEKPFAIWQFFRYNKIDIKGGMKNEEKTDGAAKNNNGARVFDILLFWHFFKSKFQYI